MSGGARQPRILVVQHQDDAPVGWVGTWLQEAGADLDVRRPYAGVPLPDDLTEHDALLVLGGEMGATDDQHPWISPTRALVLAAADDGVPTLGICLGHQLCAVALGGAVARNPGGQQIGVLDVGWVTGADADPLLGTLVDTPWGVHWNDDVVTELPPGATVLATGPGGELQAARFAPSVWGVQLHPEVDEAIVARWAAGTREVQGDAVVDAGLAAIGAAREELLDGWRPLGEALVSLARARRSGTFGR